MAISLKNELFQNILIDFDIPEITANYICIFGIHHYFRITLQHRNLKFYITPLSKFYCLYPSIRNVKEITWSET